MEIFCLVPLRRACWSTGRANWQICVCSGGLGIPGTTKNSISTFISRLSSFSVCHWEFRYASHLGTLGKDTIPGLPGHEGVPHEIIAEYLIFDDFSDFAISAAHRDGFCERTCPWLQVGVYRPHTALPWEHRSLFIWERQLRLLLWKASRENLG